MNIDYDKENKSIIEYNNSIVNNEKNEIISTSSLICSKFQDSLRIDFNIVNVGISNRCKFKLINPNDKLITLEVSKQLENKGLSILLGPLADNKLTIEPKSESFGIILWIPFSNMDIRDTLQLKLDKSYPLQVIVQGKAVDSSIKLLKDSSIKKKNLLLSSSIKNKLNSSRELTIVNDSSSLNKSLSLTTNTLNNKWINEQKYLFTDWINFQFNRLYIISSNKSDVKLNSFYDNSIMLRKSKLINKVVNHIKSINLYDNLLELCNTKQLKYRNDINVNSNIIIQKQLVDILLSYSNMWLILGIEIMNIFHNNNHTNPKKINHTYLIDYFIKNNNKIMKNALSNSPHVLSTILLYIYILDYSKNINILPNVSLFNTTSSYKSSIDIFNNIIVLLCSRENNHIDICNKIKYQLVVKQLPIDEYNYIINDYNEVFNELKDGIKLIKLLDICDNNLSNNQLINQIRYPSISRLQKVYNITIVLNTLYTNVSTSTSSRNQSDIDTLAKKIVDGNEDSLLMILWRIMYEYEIDCLINSDMIINEINSIRSIKSSNSVIIRNDTTEHSCKNKKQLITQLLIDWINEVSNKYNYTFDIIYNKKMQLDYKVLCYLMHYYHPLLISLPIIVSNDSKSNTLQLLYNKLCKHIGGIPFNSESIINNTINNQLDNDNNIIVIYLSYLFIRLTDTSKQSKASSIIKRYICKYLFNSSKKSMRQITTNLSSSLSASLTTNLNISIIMKLTTNQAIDIINGLVYKYITYKRYQRINVNNLINKSVNELTNRLSNDVYEYLINQIVIQSYNKSYYNYIVNKSMELTSEFVSDVIVDSLINKLATKSTDSYINKSVITIQSIIRRYLSYKQLQSLKENKLMQIVTGNKIYRAVSKLQAFHRGNKSRKQMYMLYLAVTLIQTLYRRKLSSRLLVRMKYCVTIINKYIYKYIEHKRLNRLTRCCTIIQSYYRRYQTMKLFNQMKRCNSCVIIQSYIRRYIAINKYKHMIHLNSCITIQSYYRRFKSMKLYKQIIKFTKCVVIQKYLRRYLAMINYKNLIKFNNCVVIQKYIRRHIAMNRYKHMLSSDHKSKLVIYKFIMSCYKSKKNNQLVYRIQKWYRVYLTFRIVKKIYRGVRRLQALYRSYRIRKNTNKKITQLRLRIRAANYKAAMNPSLKLGNRTKEALDLLLSSKSISIVLNACELLEFTTKISSRCCEAFAHVNASDILFNLIVSCNRSTPHQEILKYSLVILLNVARHQSLTIYVSKSTNSIDALINLIQMFRDRKSIFCLACELMCRLLIANPEAKLSCNQPEHKRRLDGIYNMINRQTKLDNKVKSNVGKHAVVYSPLSKLKCQSYQDPIQCMTQLMALLK